MEHVILLDDAGNAVGVADKATVHNADTPLHLAFSCYLFDRRGNVLLSRRALDKKTWPGVWTNSCCGHPAPGEDVVTAVGRRMRDELGMHVTEIELVLPRFRYRAVMDSGIVENEICPVFVANTDEQPEPNPAEVAATRWLPWAELVRDVDAGLLAVSPWCRLQLAELVTLGADPADWPIADADALPPALRATAVPAPDRNG